ncbi:MAG: HlyD family efflux transporter periplasmic adaptor subunit [Chlorobiaceae bacterium]|nr:HlyD family efflux transporter periplasmic adaptor subunit [Chlorobiaceae bacterium]
MGRSIFSASGAFFFLICILSAGGCANSGKSDGYGNFESTEVIVSTETTGKLLQFPVREGDRIGRGFAAAQIDTLQLHFAKLQLQKEKESLMKYRMEITAQAGVYRQQEINMQRDIERYHRLVSEGAVATKVLEDLENQEKVVRRQAEAVAAKNPGLGEQIASLDARLLQIEDQIAKSTVINPIEGTVLTTYAEPGEITSYGKPLYKIADLGSMYLRAYLSGTQLSSVRIGDEIDVLVDGEKPASKILRGRITWISSKAEFTPKIIQTREDRVTMVYAVKVRVDNKNGFLKIGMPGEIRFRKQ